jgi:hypothetical protein
VVLAAAGIILLRGPSNITLRAGVLRSATAGSDRVAAVEQTALAMRDALVIELGTTGTLEQGYPVPGSIVLTPVAGDPNRSTITCDPYAAPADLGSHGVCLLLSAQDSFVRIRAITWQSAAVFQHRLYVMPRNLFARVDPTRDFVAVDIYAYDEPALFLELPDIVRSAMATLGARPYRH